MPGLQNDFCDWVTLRGPCSWEPGRRPPDRYIEEYLETEDGHETEWRRPAKQQMVTRSPDGSAGTKLMFRYKPTDVVEDVREDLPAQGSFWLDGNCGRAYRSDNLFGYDAIESSMIGIRLLEKHGLRLHALPTVSRLDLTRNLVFDSQRDMTEFLEWLKGQKHGRANPTQYTSGVAWVTDNWSCKFYQKDEDLRRHHKSQLADKCLDTIGYILRFEVTLRRQQLKKMEVFTVDDLDDLNISQILDEYLSPFAGGCRPALPDFLTDLSPKTAQALLAWRDGYDHVADWKEGKISRATFYRLRKEIKALGHDIMYPAVDLRFPVSIRTIQPRIAEVPGWYDRECQPGLKLVSL